MANQHSRTQYKPWTPPAVKTLKSMAGKSTVRAIANRLNRTTGAIRQKGHSLGLSLKAKTTAKKTTTKSTARRTRTTARSKARTATTTKRATAI